MTTKIRDKQVKEFSICFMPKSYGYVDAKLSAKHLQLRAKSIMPRITICKSTAPTAILMDHAAEILEMNVPRSQT